MWTQADSFFKPKTVIDDHILFIIDMIFVRLTALFFLQINRYKNPLQNVTKTPRVPNIENYFTSLQIVDFCSFSFVQPMKNTVK